MRKIIFLLLLLVFILIIIGVFNHNHITQAEVNSPPKADLPLAQVACGDSEATLLTRPWRGSNKNTASDKPYEKGDNMSEIILPPAKTTGKMSLEEAIRKRKSVRKYSATELTIEQVSQILWSAYGANPRKRFTGRTVPSAGAIYPITVYLVNKSGVYRYQSLNHSLVLVKKGDLRSELDNGQGFIKDVSIDLVVAGNVAKCAKRYGDRAQRYVAMECGHIGQNVSLQAVSLGLDTVMVGAFDDERVRTVLSIPQEETPFYIIPVGYSAE